MKNVKIEKFIKTGLKEKKENKNIEKNREKENFELNNQFLNWNSNSCRYDSFFLFIYLQLGIFYSKKK